MKRILIILLISVFSISRGICQESIEIIDPVFPHCYDLIENQQIEPLSLGRSYFGRLLIQAEGDTINLILKNHEIVFAKLKSKDNPNDSIEIRGENKFGNWNFIDENCDLIIKHISYLRIEQTGFKDCKMPTFNIPVRIE